MVAEQSCSIEAPQYAQMDPRLRGDDKSLFCATFPAQPLPPQWSRCHGKTNRGAAVQSVTTSTTWSYYYGY